MELSNLFCAIEDAYFEKWQTEIKKADKGNYFEKMLKCKEQLKEKFSVEQIEALNAYILSVEDYYDNKFYEMSAKMLDMGVKIGVDIQKILS